MTNIQGLKNKQNQKQSNNNKTHTWNKQKKPNPKYNVCFFNNWIAVWFFAVRVSPPCSFSNLCSEWLLVGSG